MDWRNTREYRVWRANVIRRDIRCQLCDTLKGRHAHHINHATYFPELRFDEKNGICLCSQCHNHFHNDYIGSTRMKCDAHDLSEYTKIAEYFKTKGNNDDS